MARITTAPGGRHVHPNTGSTPRHRASYTTTAVVVFAFIFCFITLAARPASAIPGVSLFANGVLAAIFGPSTDSDSLSSATVNFESFANGSPNGQSGWKRDSALPRQVPGLITRSSLTSRHLHHLEQRACGCRTRSRPEALATRHFPHRSRKKPERHRLRMAGCPQVRGKTGSPRNGSSFRLFPVRNSRVSRS